MADSLNKSGGRPLTRSSASSGRKSRNLREATYHLREEALRRYRTNHQGEDPPPEWEPSAEEQYDIIRALSPPGEYFDSQLVAAQDQGAFEKLGTPRGTALISCQNTPTIIYQALVEPQDETPFQLSARVSLPETSVAPTSMPLTSVSAKQPTIDYLKPVESRVHLDRRPERLPAILDSSQGRAALYVRMVFWSRWHCTHSCKVYVTVA